MRLTLQKVTGAICDGRPVPYRKFTVIVRSLSGGYRIRPYGNSLLAVNLRSKTIPNLYAMHRIALITHYALSITNYKCYTLYN